MRQVGAGRGQGRGHGQGQGQGAGEAGGRLGRCGARCHGSLQAQPEEILMPVTEGPLFLLVGVEQGWVWLFFSSFFFFLGWSD